MSEYAAKAALIAISSEWKSKRILNRVYFGLANAQDSMMLSWPRPSISLRCQLPHIF